MKISQASVTTNVALASLKEPHNGSPLQQAAGPSGSNGSGEGMLSALWWPLGS